MSCTFVNDVRQSSEKNKIQGKRQREAPKWSGA